MSATSELSLKGRYRFGSFESDETGPNTAVQAYDTTSETNVYVKEIVVRLGKVTTLTQQENMRLSFENAARRLSELQHDSLIKVKDFYSEVGRQFLVLEDLAGDDFRTLMAKDKLAFALEDVLDWADQLLDVLNYLHSREPSVLHMNICPRNVHLSPAGRVKLVGVAIADNSGNLISSSLDEPENGVLNYSPLELIWEGLDVASQKVIVNSYDERSEKILKEAADVRSDIYSLGATLYLLLTARTPVDPLERSIELLEGNKDPLNSPSVIDPRIAPEISEVIMRSLEIKREDRYDSASIMRQVLRAAVVRVKQREAAEAQELEEAAEFLRGTQKLRIPAAFDDPTADEPSEAEVLTQKLREAEEMRLEAEGRAAEAERLLKEREAVDKARFAEKPVQSSTISSDLRSPDLVSLPADVHTSDPPSEWSRDSQSLDEPDAKPVIDLETIQHALDQPEVEKAEPAGEDVIAVKTEPSKIENRPTTQKETESFLSEKDKEREAATSTSILSYGSEDPLSSFSTSRSRLSMPLIAGVSAFIIAAGALGYVFLSPSFESNRSEPPPVQAQTAIIPSTEPQPPTAQPETEGPAAEPGNAVGDAFIETSSNSSIPTESRPEPKAVPKTVKPTPPAKKPAAKKAVTADDLINDN